MIQNYSTEVRSKTVISKCERIKKLDNICSSQLNELAHGIANLVEAI